MFVRFEDLYNLYNLLTGQYSIELLFRFSEADALQTQVDRTTQEVSIGNHIYMITVMMVMMVMTMVMMMMMPMSG